jgi:hypothetical protein
MAIQLFQVDRYEIRLGDSLSATWSDVQVSARGVIACHGEDHRLLIYFLGEHSPVPEPVFDPGARVGAIFLPFHYLPHYVDLLRNESPIYAYLNSENPRWNSIRTTQEPVGEGE